MEGSDWESSFSHILNRTKHNLNRINSRYAPGVAPTLQDTSILAPRGVINNENVHQNALLLDRFSKTDTFLRTDGAGRGTAVSPTGGADVGVLERLIRIEEHHRATESATSSRLASLENALEMAVSRSDRSSQQMKDLEHSVTLLNTTLNSVSGFIELLQGENESKRTVFAKMDNWIRQGEIWREELDGKVETLTKLTKTLDRSRTEQRELAAEHVTRYELEQLRDKMSVITQQSVAASLSAWHDKMEQSVRNVERQIALLRIGMTDAGRGSLGSESLLSPDEVAAALANPLPSELLLKGTVAHEVLQMQTQLEEKLESRLQLFLKDKVETSHLSLNKELQQQLHNLCAEMGLDYPEIELDGASIDATGARARENYRIRLLEARKRSDEEVAELTRNVNRVTKDLATLQQTAASDQVHSAAVVSNLDRKVEECLAVCGTSVRTVSERASKLEDLVRDTELAIRTAVNDNKSELVERLGDMAREWSTERAGLDRRLLVNERIAEDCLDRIKLSQSAVESYFKASPDIKRFQRSAELVAQLQTQLSGVQEEARATAVAVHKLEANASSKNEHLELRERVARLEPTVLEKLPGYMESTKRMEDLSMSMQSRLDKLDTLTTRQHNDLVSTISRVSAVDVLAMELKGLTTVATEEVKRLSSAVAELGAGTRKDINYLRDLTGSISSRVGTVEGKVNVMTKSFAADAVSTNNTLAKLSTICEDLQAHDATTQNTLVQLQWAIEAEHRETEDRFAQLKGRLDLLHHVQSTAGGDGGGGVSRTGEGKAIRIQFTTATDADAADATAEAEGSFGAEASTMYFASPAAPTAQAQQQSWAEAESSAPPQPPRVTAPAKVPAEAAVQAALPPPVKASTRAGSAFLTEPFGSSMSSPEKSATSNASARSWSPLPPTAEMAASVRDTAAATAPAVERDSFVAARDYSYDEAERPSAVDEFPVSSADAADAGSLNDGDDSGGHSSQASDSGDGDIRGRTQGGAAADMNASASRIVGQSAFDISMPSYVSHINSSGDVNQSSANYSYRHDDEGPIASAGASGDHSPASKLSVGSDDSVDQLNSAVEELVKHRERVLSNEARSPSSSWSATQRAPGGGNTSASVTYNVAVAEEKDSSSEDEDESDQGGHSDSSDEFAHDSEGEDDFGGEVAGHDEDVGAGGSRSVGASRTEMQEVEESSDSQEGDGSDADDSSKDEFDHDADDGEDGGNDGQESAYTKSEATSVAGSYSQLDALHADSSRPAPTEVPAASRMENSWDDSFVTGQSSSSPSKEHSRSTISGSSDSHGDSGFAAKASPMKKPAFAIPALNMGGLPVRATEAEEIPSYRSTGRDLSQYAPGSSSRRDVSDWDAESSHAASSISEAVPQSATAAAPAPVRAAVPILDVSNLSGTSTAVPAEQDVSAINSGVIGASEGAHGQSVDDSTAGASISDTSISSSNVTASSNSYLTISSASPQKATVAAPALAAVPRVAVPAPAPALLPAASAVSSVTTSTASAARLDTSTTSKKDSIKERLKNRLNKNKASDAASVTSASAADDVMGFDD